MHGLHVILHLVRSREFLTAHRTREHFALLALVIEERVPLEAVLVFEGLLKIEFGALRALIHAFADGRITEEVQAAHRHLRELFSRVLGLRCRASSHATFRCLTTARR